MRPDHTAIILLASGLSERFGADDKLLALLNGKPVGSYAANLFIGTRTSLHCAIVPENSPARATLYRETGWQVLENADPAKGQGHSLARATEQILQTDAEAALVLLADMPFITEAYLRSLITSTQPDHAVMSVCNEILQPPAIFPRSAFALLAKSCGDRGARGIFETLERTQTHTLCPRLARDVDTPEALSILEKELHHV